MAFDWKKEVGDRLRDAAKLGYKYKNVGSALIGVAGLPSVATFLANPYLDKYIQRYGVVVEDAWDSMFDGDFEGAGAAVYGAFTDWLSESGFVPRRLLGRGQNSPGLVEVTRELTTRTIPSVDEIRGNPALDGRFEDDAEGGSLLSPSLGDINEEEIVCIKRSDLPLLLNSAANSRSINIAGAGTLPTKTEESGGGGGALLLGLAALAGAGYVGYRLLK